MGACPIGKACPPSNEWARGGKAVLSPAADEAARRRPAQAGRMRSVSRAAVAVATAMTLFASGCTSGATPRPAACDYLDAARVALDRLGNADVR